jgi:hypothetical protein
MKSKTYSLNNSGKDGAGQFSATFHPSRRWTRLADFNLAIDERRPFDEIRHRQLTDERVELLLDGK